MSIISKGAAGRRCAAHDAALHHALNCWLIQMAHPIYHLASYLADHRRLQVGARDGGGLKLQQVPQPHRCVEILAEPREEGHARRAVEAPDGERQHGRDADPAAHGNQNGSREGRGGAGRAAKRQLAGGWVGVD